MNNLKNKLNLIIQCLLNQFRKIKTNKSLIETFGIIFALSMIFMIWINYPSIIPYMDKHLKSQSQSSSIVTSTSLQTTEIKQTPITKFQQTGEMYGTYGDSYGSLNTLFSGFAFAILIISLFMQRQELHAQRKELEAQRLEIKESNTIAEEQRKITAQQATLIEQQIHDSKVQAFYQLFFKYLEEKDRKLQALKLTPTSEIIGSRMLEKFITAFENNFKGRFLYAEHISKATTDEVDKAISQGISHAHQMTRNKLKESEYFEYIYFILSFIDNHKYLGITDNAIKTFKAYQSIDEMYCMLLIATEDEYLCEYINQFSLLSKIIFYTENKTMNEIIYCKFDEDAYS